MKTIAASVAIVAFAVAFAFIRPRDVLGRLPKPSGSFAVGSSIVSLPRVPGLSAGATSAQIWYPTSATSGARLPYAYGLHLAPRERLLAAFVRTEAFVDAPVVTGRRTVIAYVPGLGGNRANNSALAQDLASHGFIVVGFDDTRPGGGFDFSSAEAAQRSFAWGNAKVRAQAGDLSRALDALAALDRDSTSRFAGRLDLRRVGVLGFSFGGAVAAELATHDSRVAAAVNLDGWMFGNALHAGVGRAYLVISSDPIDGSFVGNVSQSFTDEASFDRYDGALVFTGLRRRGGYAVTVADTGHYNFSDAALLPSVRHSGMGRIAPLRGHRIIASYVCAFFDRYLAGEQAPLLDAHVPTDPAADVRRFDQPPKRSIER